jgi:hypothetical protein
MGLLLFDIRCGPGTMAPLPPLIWGCILITHIIFINILTTLIFLEFV